MSEWVSVNDRLPENGVYLVYYQTLDGLASGQACCDYLLNWITCDDIEVTHWMPLPAKPSIKHTGIFALELRPRCEACLLSRGVASVEHLGMLTPNELLRTNNLGEGSLNEIMTAYFAYYNAEFFRRKSGFFGRMSLCDLVDFSKSGGASLNAHTNIGI